MAKNTSTPKRSAPPAGPVRQHYELATTGKISGQGSSKPAPKTAPKKR